MKESETDRERFRTARYRDNNHTSILSLPESYEASDVRYYDALAKNMDANLAEADMESFRTEDIHALLTNLPPMCTDHLSQENNRQGESFASVSGSMMAKLDFDSSLSPHTSSQGEESANSTTMSICKSELLFSPVKETCMPDANFSVDSLDCDLLDEHDIMLTCKANKDNYTIAFEGSVTMYSEDSDYHETDKSEASARTGSSNWHMDLKNQARQKKLLEGSMTRSDCSSFTTWSKLKTRSSENQLRRLPSGNNNDSSQEDTARNLNDNPMKSQSMPNLYKRKLKELLHNSHCNALNSSSISMETRSRPVKVFDIQHQTQSSNSGNQINDISDMAISLDGGSTNSDHNKKQQQNFSLVKLYMKQKSMSAEGMSTALDQSTASENWPGTQSSNSNISDSKPPPATEQHRNDFEDSLLIDHKNLTSNSRSYEVIAEDQENEMVRSESVERLSESTTGKSEAESVENSSENEYECSAQQFNVNNNNNSGDYKRNVRSRSTNTKQRLGNSVLGASTSSNSTNSSYTHSERKYTKYTRHVPVHLMNRSMQTSNFAELNNLKNAPYKMNYGNDKEKVKVIEPSFLHKLKEESEVPKPVYVLYPSYALPDLDFLKNKDDHMTKVLLVPQNPKTTPVSNKKRPFSCNDVEALKKKGFGHVQDWDSLNFLLPNEYKQILANVPEATRCSQKKTCAKEKFSLSKAKDKVRPHSCDYDTLERTNSLDRAPSSSSSTATQPSSGYRGSSTILTDSQNSPAPVANLNPLFVYRYDSVTSSEASSMASDRQRSITTTAPPLPKRSISLTNDQLKHEPVPPRPPLPRGILRKSVENKLRHQNTKRYSMFEMTEQEILEEISTKRKSLQDSPYYLPNKRLSETEDEGVDAGTSSSSLDEQTDPNGGNFEQAHRQTDLMFSNLNSEDLAQLEEFLKLSGISSSDHDDMDEKSMTQLRSCVSKFLTLKINQDNCKKCVSFSEKVKVLPKNLEGKFAPNNSPNASTMMNQRQYQVKTLAEIPICEEGEMSPENHSSPHSTAAHRYPHDLTQKRALVDTVTNSVEQLIHHFSNASDQSKLNALGDSSLNPACAKLTLASLCPAIYAILSDGLKPSLETSFGAIGNSVWQVVEASARQGPLTKALNELVGRINDEDVITEGLVKFNSFVFGLLNVRSLDAWISYFRTRESIIKKHYNPDSLLVLSLTGSAVERGLVDTLIESLQPLALLPFQFDLLFEYRQLHESLRRMDSYPQPPTSKLWKCLHSMHSNYSNSDTEEASACTAIHCVSPDKYEEEKLPINNIKTSPVRSPTRMDKPRPRSCIDTGYLSKPDFKLGEDVTNIAKKRWSGIPLTSKLFQAYNRLAHDSDEEYTDSLENTGHHQQHDDEITQVENIPQDLPESLDSNLSDDKPLNGKKFKKLQMKWEMLSGKELNHSPPESPTHKSKIPKPIVSPNRPSGIPVPISPSAKSKSIPKKTVTTPGGNSGNKKFVGTIQIMARNSPVRKNGSSTRTSRLDQLESGIETTRKLTRPSSLPYRTVSQAGYNGKMVPPRRAVSTSVNRRPNTQTPLPKVVRTLSHRLPSESGHLSYNEGERLKVVLEVDEQWLLCCRGTQKGLVPKSAVIADSARF